METVLSRSFKGRREIVAAAVKDKRNNSIYVADGKDPGEEGRSEDGERL